MKFILMGARTRTSRGMNQRSYPSPTVAGMAENEIIAYIYIYVYIYIHIYIYIIYFMTRRVFYIYKIKHYLKK